jgi:hypothetical protein
LCAVYATVLSGLTSGLCLACKPLPPMESRMRNYHLAAAMRSASTLESKS